MLWASAVRLLVWQKPCTTLDTAAFSAPVPEKVKVNLELPADEPADELVKLAQPPSASAEPPTAAAVRPRKERREWTRPVPDGRGGREPVGAEGGCMVNTSLGWSERERGREPLRVIEKVLEMAFETRIY